jgi:uncharacterized protein
MAVWTDATSLKILISDDDTYNGRPLYEVIVHAARDAKLAGAKVIRGITGYGRSRHIHETWHGFSYDMPVVVELIDTDAKIDAFLPTVQRLRAGALVTRQPVQILEPHGATETTTAG